jgi:hypothetical protein
VDAITLAQILSLAKDTSIVALLFVCLWGGARGIWVWGWYYRQVCDERDDWRRAALTGTNAAERLATLAQERRRP